MFSSQDLTTPGGENLEDRLRGLILSNANANPSSAPVSELLSQPAQKSPPHMLSGVAQIQLDSKTNMSPPTGPNNQSSAGHKRPNQAQRRQMNAQLSIPTNSRPEQGIQAGREMGAFSSQTHGQYGHSLPQIQQRYNHHQQFNPRFQNTALNSPYAPYAPRSPFPQASPGFPMPQSQPGPSPQFQARSGPNSFQHQAQQNAYARPPAQSRQLYQPGPNSAGRGRPQSYNAVDISSQGAYLEKLVQESVQSISIDSQEEAEKETFRALVESICRATITEYEQQELENANFDKSSVQLQCFGSMKSGFATKASDMDLALLSPKSHPAPDCPESPIPRLLEKRLLDLGYGARLLTRTRVPIIKLCQQPTQKLLSLLIDERSKWESGFLAEAEDENIDEHHAGPDVDVAQTAERPRSQDSLPKGNHPGASDSNSYKKRLASLKQKEHQSLADYYSLAKRILRKLGGRDLTPSASYLTGDEPKILNDVCSAFILGLHDSVLVTQLSSYTSITPLLDPSLPFLQRTLHGIWTQIDGERLALRWEHRSLPEVNDKLEADGADAIYGWRALQNREDSVADPLIYNRQVTAASERLKRYDSLRLMCLEQIQYEEPVYYFGRAQKILENFTNHSKVSNDQIVRIAIERYVKGIFNPEIRQALYDRVQNLDDSTATLGRVALHHRILQLASDYEHALKLRFYDDCEDGDREDIEKYIKHLRGLQIEDSHKPSDVEITQLISKMKSLPDPTKLSTSKPRDRYQDHLEFPKTGVGIQCDINFSAQLALHNTQLLRCYSHCDPRVRPMILFIKHWAKVRGINSPYRGTLSSYGYVLMVLHFLINVAMPFVLPNLQEIKRDPPPYLSPADILARTVCNGRDVRFWRNEMEIQDLAQRNMLNHNHESIGILLRSFFEYYAQGGPMSTVQNRGFDWGREVLSIRTHGGILTKQEKGWVGAKTIIETTTVAAPPTPYMAKHTEHANNGEASPTSENEVQAPKLPMKTVEETKEVRHRYLFAIEDPFELDHNVARTVTHNGIVSIRDEFRRAWRFIRDAKTTADGVNLLDPVENNETRSEFLILLDLIHGLKGGEMDVRA